MILILFLLLMLLINPPVQVVFKQTSKDNLEVAITNSFELEKEEEIEHNHDLKKTAAGLHSLPMISIKYEVSSIQLPVTHSKLLPSVV